MERPNGSRFCCGAPLDSNTDGQDLAAPAAASVGEPASYRRVPLSVLEVLLDLRSVPRDREHDHKQDTRLLRTEVVGQNTASADERKAGSRRGIQGDLPPAGDARAHDMSCPEFGGQ